MGTNKYGDRQREGYRKRQTQRWLQIIRSTDGNVPIGFFVIDMCTICESCYGSHSQAWLTVWHICRIFVRGERKVFGLTLHRKLDTNILRNETPYIPIHVILIDFMIGMPILLYWICGPIAGIYKLLTDTWMYVIIGNEAAKFHF
jgi:hypothetical protein